MGVGAFGVLAGGCSFGWWGDGFVVMALVLGFRGIWVWACGLGSREGTWILSCPSVLTILSSFFHYFSDRFCLWQTFLLMRVVVVAVFTLLCFLGPGLGLGCGGGLVPEYWLEPVWLVSGWWGGVGLVCCGVLMCIIDSGH